MYTCLEFCVYHILFFVLAGYLGTDGPSGALAFLRTRYADNDKLYPDIHMQMSSSLVGGVFKRNWNLKDDVSGYLFYIFLFNFS